MTRNEKYAFSLLVFGMLGWTLAVVSIHAAYVWCYRVERTCTLVHAALDPKVDSLLRQDARWCR